MRTQSVILNLIPSGVNPVVHLSQYDQEDDGALLFNIYDGNVLADLTGCTATIEGTKPDGTFYMYPCTVYSTYLTSAVNFQMTSIAGSYPAEVRINRGAENVGTINITMMVEPAGVGRVDVSDTEIPNLLDDIETSVDEAEYWAHVAEHAVTGVASWNGRTGAVVPVAGDYDASQVDYDNTNSGLTAITEQGAIDELTPKKIITSNDAFDPTKTYTAGEWLIHQGVLYEVLTACTGVTPPNATYYVVKTLHDLQSEISALNNEIENQTHYGAVGANSSRTITPKGDGFGCFLLLIKRAAINLHAFISYDYWQNTYDVISGVVPQSIILTKNALSGAITITNNTGATITFLLLE